MTFCPRGCLDSFDDEVIRGLFSYSRVLHQHFLGSDANISLRQKFLQFLQRLKPKTDNQKIRLPKNRQSKNPKNPEDFLLVRKVFVEVNIDTPFPPFIQSLLGKMKKSVESDSKPYDSHLHFQWNRLHFTCLPSQSTHFVNGPSTEWMNEKCHLKLRTRGFELKNMAAVQISFRGHIETSESGIR